VRIPTLGRSKGSTTRTVRTPLALYLLAPKPCGTAFYDAKFGLEQKALVEGQHGKA
jgi:hypothetical protein